MLSVMEENQPSIKVRHFSNHQNLCKKNGSIIVRSKLVSS